MTKTTTAKKTKNKTSETARATVIIDFGNGRVKIKVRQPGGKAWSDYDFPSYVAESPRANKNCLTLITNSGLKTYAVGENAAHIPNARTGISEGRKAEVSDVLFLNALRTAFGVPEETGEEGAKKAGEIHCDVIFTSPSVASYGDEMAARLTGRHHVQIPTGQYAVGSQAKNYVVQVHSAVPMLEGHLAYSALGLKETSWILDIGNRTTIATLVDTDNDIIDRRAFDDCGVYSMADYAVTNELLANYLKTPSPQTVIDFLLDGEGGDSIARAFGPALNHCTTEAMEFIKSANHDIHIIGGGAKLPGVAEALGGTVADKPDTVNVDGIAKLADIILGSE